MNKEKMEGYFSLLVVSFSLLHVNVFCQTTPCDKNGSNRTCILAAGFDDYQVATCSSNSDLLQNGFRCEDSCTDTCWHLCMVEKFGQINGSVSSNCSCKPYFPALPSWCYTVSGHCGFNNCTLLKYAPMGCSPENHLNWYQFYNFLCKIVNDFFRYLDCNTKIWLDGFRKCSQQYLIDNIIVGSVNCSDLEMKGEEAFNTCIEGRYNSTTFCELPNSSDKNDIRESIRTLETQARSFLPEFNITAGVQFLNCPST